MNRKFSVGIRFFLFLGFAGLFSGCGDSGDAGEKVNQESSSGVFLQILLVNPEGEDMSYVLFNPNVKTIEECNQSAQDDMNTIIELLPPELQDSKVTGSSCSYTNPELGDKESES
ncbi:MAG: hypothetical protein ACO3I1_01415 [Burkholderiales bacterium]|jgi:hypothetical protein